VKILLFADVLGFDVAVAYQLKTSGKGSVWEERIQPCWPFIVEAKFRIVGNKFPVGGDNSQLC